MDKPKAFTIKSLTPSKKEWLINEGEERKKKPLLCLYSSLLVSLFFSAMNIDSNQLSIQPQNEAQFHHAGWHRTRLLGQKANGNWMCSHSLEFSGNKTPKQLRSILDTRCCDKRTMKYIHRENENNETTLWITKEHKKWALLDDAFHRSIILNSWWFPMKRIIPTALRAWDYDTRARSSLI